jgi:hypothetical protein
MKMERAAAKAFLLWGKRLIVDEIYFTEDFA